MLRVSNISTNDSVFDNVIVNGITIHFMSYKLSYCQVVV